MLSSWSTSLNLIFLSVAWTTIAASYSPLQLELVAPLVLRLSLYIIPSLAFLLFDIGVPSLAVEFKSQGKWGIPSNQKGGAKVVRRVVAWSCANVLLTVVLQAGIEFLVTDVLRMKSLLLIKGSRWGLNHLPNPWIMVKHGIIGLVSRNVLQYYIHTHLLHSPTGGILSDLHQSWHHSIRIPYSFAANYDHPICHLLHRFVPLYLPAIALRMHILTYLIMVGLFSLEETFVYSGYNVLPSTIMLRGMARRADAHMMSEGEGNYGCLGVMDWFHDTTLGKDVVEDLKAEMDKHNVEAKAGKAFETAGDAANGFAGKFGRSKKGKGRK
ncbi:hypothetical protein ACJQWK_08960 [Exserohilum turcicum]|uniref:Fatty acid hydroxylase domain-containing protein n=1 Tax=Exserohilum turcicum (strain 28A) TaxID=671987 RepID=R0K173_EXST2|nr:uncharacterized protein SETTUDRAFT_88198 [Exserohilum turcica Et28A]EOA86908.1 hypothetical protein SETTUDRAFT_88198 [Exserohilum turcica Et28A]